jgi:hypothetical protein
MSNVYWAFIAGAAVCFLLGTVEHFGALFLLPIASARAFLSLADFCLLFAIALAAGSLMPKQQAKDAAAEQATDE